MTDDAGHRREEGDGLSYWVTEEADTEIEHGISQVRGTEATRRHGGRAWLHLTSPPGEPHHPRVPEPGGIDVLRSMLRLE